MPNKSANSRPDRLASAIAGRQHGMVTRSQLIAVGLLPSGITDRVRAGRLHRIHRGVYALGHTALGDEGKWMAAVLASGEGAALSHRSAAELWGMLKAIGGVIHVSIPTSAGRRPHRGIRLHRSPYLPKSATTHHNGIAVTTPARTIADLRRVATVDELRRAIREAEYLKLPIGDPLGARDELTRSKLERRFLALCRRHRLPKPEVTVKIEGYEVDFLWRAERLVVEVDGYRSHGTRSAFESDRDRDARLKLLGYEVLRFTDRSVTGDPAGVAAMVRALLARPLGLACP